MAERIGCQRSKISQREVWILTVHRGDALLQLVRLHVDKKLTLAACDGRSFSSFDCELKLEALLINPRTSARTDLSKALAYTRIPSAWLRPALPHSPTRPLDTLRGFGSMTYTGTLNAEGQPNGEGCHTLPDGHGFNGQWQDGKYHGAGTETFSSGATFKGTWTEDEKQGPGVYAFQSEGGRYEGQFVGGKRHGKGVYLFASGARYEGEWEHDKRVGGAFIPAAEGAASLVDASEWNDAPPRASTGTAPQEVGSPASAEAPAVEGTAEVSADGDGDQNHQATGSADQASPSPSAEAPTVEEAAGANGGGGGGGLT